LPRLRLLQATLLLERLGTVARPLGWLGEFTAHGTKKVVVIPPPPGEPAPTAGQALERGIPHVAQHHPAVLLFDIDTGAATEVVGEECNKSGVTVWVWKTGSIDSLHPDGHVTRDGHPHLSAVSPSSSTTPLARSSPIGSAHGPRASFEAGTSHPAPS
jgi:hypothetical protein